jgi:hypothetical protein
MLAGVPLLQRKILVLSGVLFYASAGATHRYSGTMQGDALRVVAAIFYATYERTHLFHGANAWSACSFITNKVTTISGIECGLLWRRQTGSTTNSNSAAGLRNRF